MTARSSMTMRADVSRESATGDDDWGRPSRGAFSVVATDVPCKVWSSTANSIREDGQEVVIETIRAMFPSGANIQADDRVTSVRDRLGRTLYTGPLAVGPVVRKGRRGSHGGHLSVALLRHRQETAA